MTFEIYRRMTVLGRKWFWRLKAKNHRIIAVGGEGFANRQDVLSIIDRIVNDIENAEVRDG